MHLAKGGKVWEPHKPQKYSSGLFYFSKSRWIAFSVSIFLAISLSAWLFYLYQPPRFKNSYIITSDTFDYKTVSPLLFLLPIAIAYFVAVSFMFLIKGSMSTKSAIFILIGLFAWVSSLFIINPPLTSLQDQANLKIYSWIKTKTGDLPISDETVVQGIASSTLPGAYNFKDDAGNEWLITVNYSIQYNGGTEYKIAKLAQ